MLLERAIQYWNTVDSRKYFVSIGVQPWGADDPMTGGFIPIQLVPAESLWDLGLATCGNASMIVRNASGCIRRAKIKIADKCTGPIEVFETIVRHELGHVLGLKDNYLEWNAIMSAVAAEGMQEHPVEANHEERKALRELYGP